MAFKRICVIHLNQIGDLVFSLPLLKALRETHPGVSIHSIIRPHLRDLLVCSPYIDRMIYRERGIMNALKLLIEIRQNRYDLLVTLSNSIECLLLATFSGARLKAGFEHFPWDWRLHLKEKVEGHHSWYNNLKLLKKLNVEVSKKDYVGLLVLPELESSGARPYADLLDSRNGYVAIAAGTSVRRGLKAWEEKKFGELIVLLKNKYGLAPVLLGSEGDREVNERIVESVKKADSNKKVDRIFNLTGRIGMKELGHILKKASLFVGVDTGIMHLASSLDIPVVGIFGPTDPFYVGPLNTRSVVAREEDLDCIPCYLKGCEERSCLKRLEVEKVFHSCEQVLHPGG